MITTRRSLLTGLGALLAAPAIVRASSLMPVKAWVEEPLRATERFLQGPSGQIAFRPLMGVSANKWAIVGAGTRIHRGDVVCIKNDGYAYPVWSKDGAIMQQWGGVALTDSSGHYCNTDSSESFMFDGRRYKLPG